MRKIQNIFLQFGDNFKKNRILGSVQKTAIQFISQCRTSSMGELFKQCHDCGHQEVSYCSCRNRHCPQCQTYAKEKWIHARKCDLLNVRYFHIVFTLPAEISAIARYNRSKMFQILFQSVSETLKTLGHDPKWLGAQIGAMLILHTWTQRLLFHPHIHALVPNGGLQSNRKWKYGKKKFFIPVRVLGELFRGKYMHYFLKAIENNELRLPDQYSLLYLDEHYKKEFTKSMYNKKWYVYAKRAFNGPESVIEYLGRYTHRICISDYRIENVTEKEVTFTYHDNKDNGKLKRETLLGEEFIRRFLWHTLPSGFVKIRYIGLLSNRNKKDKLAMCQRLTKSLYMIEQFKKITVEMILARVSHGKAGTCSICGSDKIQIYTTNNRLLNRLQIE
jgi:hypothetical protein